MFLVDVIIMRVGLVKIITSYLNETREIIQRTLITNAKKS